MHGPVEACIKIIRLWEAKRQLDPQFLTTKQFLYYYSVPRLQPAYSPSIHDLLEFCGRFTSSSLPSIRRVYYFAP